MKIDEEAFNAAKLAYEAEFADAAYVTFSGLEKAIEAYEQAKKSVMGEDFTRKDEYRESAEACATSPATSLVQKQPLKLWRGSYDQPRQMP